MKKFAIFLITAFLAPLYIFGLSCCSADEIPPNKNEGLKETFSDGVFNYRLIDKSDLENGGTYILESVKDKSITKATVPARVNGKAVSKIGKNAFGGCEKMEELSFGEESEIKEIGAFAFNGCDALQSLTLPDGVEKIGNGAFGGCKALENLVMPEGVEKINEYSFSGCEALEKVTLANEVTAIEKYAFEDCKALKEIIIPDSVETIGHCAFFGCSSLERVTLSANTKRNGSYIFERCTSLKYLLFKGTPSQWNMSNWGFWQNFGLIVGDYRVVYI